MPPGVKKKQRRRYRNEPDSVTARFISDSSSDSDFEVRMPHVKYSEYKKKSRGCTSTEKSLCAVIIVFIIVCIVLAALLVTQFVLSVGAFRKQEPAITKPQNMTPVLIKHAKTCTSPTCVMVAGKIFSRMDLNVEPCDNYYNYTCGQWMSDLTLPPDKSRYSMFTEVDERNTGRVRELLASEGSKLMGVDSTAVQKAKDFYKACMNEAIIEERGSTPLLLLIKELGSWPVTSGDSGTWDEDNWDFFHRLIQIHKFGASPLFDMSVGPNLRNVEEHIITFDQSGLTFSDRSFYLDDSISPRYYNAFRNYFAAVTVLLGADNSTGYQVADDIWQLEKKIANITVPPEDRQDSEKLYHKMTVAELQDIMGSWIDVPEYLTSLFGYKVGPRSELVVYAPEFLGKIGDIVKATSKSTLASYMMWHGASSGLSYMPYPFRQASLAFSTALYGVTARPPEWKICVSRTSSAIGQASGALFVEKYFSKADKVKVEAMLETIKEEFKAQIPTLDWMDEETKKLAIEKVTAVDNMIAYPDMAENPADLDKYYEKMKVTDNDPFQNFRYQVEFYVNKNLQKLTKVPDRKEWEMAPNVVNAYYSPTKNQMVFPAGILQYPFYDPSFPYAVNYGAIGMVMGHELTHGFDNSGRQYDKLGNLRNWWSQSSKENFLDRTQCIIDQYNSYTIGKKHVNGKLTQGENIADNGGLKTAYGAYQRWLKDHNNEELAARLPAFNVTETQAFFLGFGQIWCAYVTPKYAEQALATDPHSPPSYRVLGSLNNMQEFSDAFYCRRGSAMNNPTKCTVW